METRYTHNELNARRALGTGYVHHAAEEWTFLVPRWELTIESHFQSDRESSGDFTPQESIRHACIERSSSRINHVV